MNPNRIITVLFVFLSFAACSIVFAQKETPSRLATDGSTEYIIVLPAAPSPVEQTAAKELKTHLEASTGAAFPVFRENELPESDAKKPKLVVGNSALMRKLLPNVEPAKLSADAIVLQTVGNDIILAGHPQRGTLYAVYELLENHVGVRWWSLTETDIPKKPILEIPPLNVHYAPKLIYREAYYLDAFEDVFGARLRCNGNKSLNSPEYGGRMQIMGFVHTFDIFIPPDKYFDKHPEWFSEINGERKKHGGQLCLTNEEMTQEMIRVVMNGLREDPSMKIVSVSQNDWHGYCQCARCNAVAEEEGGNVGGQAGLMVRFVNKIAEAVEEEFPDVFVDTLAYTYTRKPPKLVKPRKNVVIRLCSIECSFVQPLDGPQNKSFHDDIVAWSRMSQNLFIWDYVTNFSGYMLPHPNLRVLAPNIRFFVNHNTIGLLEQGDAYCTAGDFVRMRTWVLSKLLWNPDLDDKALFDEFLTGYYGKASAPFLKEYWNLLIDRAEQSGVFLGTFQHSTHHWLDDATFVKAYCLMQQALDAAETETYKNRLRRDKMPMDIVLLKERYYPLRREAERTGQPFFGPPDPLAAVDDFLARCREFDVVAYEERNWQPQFNEFARLFREGIIPRTAPPPEFCRDLFDDSWLDIQNHEFNVSPRFRAGAFQQVVRSAADPAASNGWTAKISGNAPTWMVNYRFGRTLETMKPCQSAVSSPKPLFRLLAAVRCETKNTEGTAFTLGIHDFDAKKSVATKSFSINEVAGPNYRWVDFGTIALEPQHTIYFAPAATARGGFIYVDRLVLVRTDSMESVFEVPSVMQTGPDGEAWQLIPAEQRLEATLADFVLPSPEKYGISNDKVITMPGIYDGKAVTYPLGKAAEQIGTRGNLYVLVSCWSQSGNGPGILFGITDTAAKKNVVSGAISVKAVGDRYGGLTWYKIGGIPLSKDGELWFSAPGKLGNINASYIERLVITP